MDFLTKDQIFKVKDVKYQDVDMMDFGWPGKVRIGVMSGTARDSFELDVFGEDGKKKNFKNLRAKLLAACIVDPKTGETLFKTPEDIKNLGLRSSLALDKLFEIARKMNGVLSKSEVNMKAKNS